MSGSSLGQATCLVMMFGTAFTGLFGCCRCLHLTKGLRLCVAWTITIGISMVFGTAVIDIETMHLLQAVNSVKKTQYLLLLPPTVDHMGLIHHHVRGFHLRLRLPSHVLPRRFC